MKHILTPLSLGFFIIFSLVISTLYILEIGGSKPAESTHTTSEESFPQAAESSATPASEEESSSMNTFSAKFGRFSLSLDEIYTVVVKIDGDVDGDSSTKIEIARNFHDQAGAASAYLNDSVKIEAFSTATHGTRDQFVTSDTVLQASGSKQSRVDIAGIEARKFIINTLGQTEKYYFENNGITYLIEAWDTSSGTTTDTLNDVLRGFKFN